MVVGSMVGAGIFTCAKDGFGNCIGFMAAFGPCAGSDYNFSEVRSQLRRTMLVTVFVFIRVEGASVFSHYAKYRAGVGWATVMGFLGVLCLMFLATLRPYGVLLRPEIAEPWQPSAGIRCNDLPARRGLS